MTINPLTALSAAETANTEMAAPTSSIGQDQFLKLLVEQLKHQDPLSPTDSDKFIAQLAQFSQLEETIGIRQNLDKLLEAMGINQVASE